MPLTQVHVTVHSPIVRTTKTIVETEVQSMPLTQVHMTVHSPIVRTTKTIVEAEVQSMSNTGTHDHSLSYSQNNKDNRGSRGAIDV